MARLLGRQAQSAPVGAYPNQWPGAHTCNLGWARTLISSPAAWVHRQKAPGWARNWISGWLPCAQTQSRGSAANQSPKLRSATQPDQGPGCLQATTAKSTGSEKLLPSPFAQNPAGPIGSLGGRQNSQQRGAAGLRETAFPRKTRPSRGLNYPIVALRAPSI